MKSQIKLAFFSDTHLREDLIFPEDIDVYFHCGDLMNNGNITELKKAAAFFKSKLNGKKLYYTPGNHDNIFESSKVKEGMAILKDAGIETVIDQQLTIVCKGHAISCYFMPWIPETIPSHSFNLEDILRKTFIDKIPIEGIDLLITHGPPDYILDSEPSTGYHFGDQLLKEKISHMKGLKVHAFGHVHGARGIYTDDDGIVFINAASGSRGPSTPIVLAYPT